MLDVTFFRFILNKSLRVRLIQSKLIMIRVKHGSYDLLTPFDLRAESFWAYRIGITKNRIFSKIVMGNGIDIELNTAFFQRIN